MKKLSEFKGDEAFDLLGNILEPTVKMFTDKEIVDTYRSKDAKKIEIVNLIVKKHREEIIEIMALLNEQTPEDYKENMTVISLINDVLELFNDPDIMAVFQSQGQMQTSSVSVKENIGEEEK